MFEYITIGANDLTVSVPFYEALLGVFGYKKCHEGSSVGFAPDGDYTKGQTIWVSLPYNKEPAIPSNGTMIGFEAKSKAMVDEFHKVALANGGSSEGAPGVREQYGPTFYVAYIRDPVGNKFSALYIGE